MNHMTVTCGAMWSDFPGYSNVSIQGAIDYVSAFGEGEVVLSEGIYTLRDSVHLRSGVSLRGAGVDKTVLKKAPSVKCTTENYCGYGHSEITITDASIFHVGDGVFLTDSGAGGFYATQSTVQAIDGNTIYLRHALNGDVAKARGGYIESVFPLIRGENVDGVMVTRLTLDGNAENNGYINGCRGGGIFLIACGDIYMKDIRVTNYNGDAVSYQQCVNIRVIASRCDGNRGNGLHPGSGTVGMSIEDCIIENNLGNGIYYCLRIHHNICRGNVIRDNGAEGISVGHRDDYVDISDNEIYGNGREGIIFRNDGIPSASGKYTSVRQNRIYDNARVGGIGEIYAPLELTGLQMYGNRVGGKVSLSLAAPLVDSYIWDNEFSGEVIAPSADAYHPFAPEQLRVVDIDSIPEKEYKHLSHL